MLVGLTGKSCSGKNYTALYLQKKGFEVWDLDVIGHECLENSVDELVKVFGEGVISCSGDCRHVDRKALGRIVFGNPELRTKLEEILYPEMKRMIAAHEESDPEKVLILNGALLYRAGLDTDCDSVIYVDAPYEDRLERALLRDGTDAASFEKREASQQDVDFRDVAYRCQLFIIHNEKGVTGDIVNRQIDDICDSIL